ncbi:ankyrin, partial [Choiromyces venosus 120613-1]
MQDFTGTTALSHAAFYKHQEVTQVLLKDKGILVNLPNNNGRTLLYRSLMPEYPSYEVISSLLADPRVDVNQVDENGLTPIHSAMKANSSEIVDLLTSHARANISQVDNSGCTAL